MKILFNTYPMAFHTPGGGEIQLTAYFEALKNRGIEVNLFNPWDPKFSNYDLVHFFSCVGGSSHFCNFVKQIGMPLVISSSLWITAATKNLYPVDEIRMQLSLADCIITNSNAESKGISEILNIPIDKFSVVYNGVDPIFLQPIGPELFIDRFKVDRNFILNVGNIEPRKNQLNLVKAMKNFPNSKLVLIGHIRNAEYAEEVFKIGADQVKYIKYLDHSSPLLRSAYAGCDVFCLPSMLETPGLAALEASCSNLNNIAITEEGCTKEYFGQNAVYLDPKSVESISWAIQEAGKSRLNQRRQLEIAKTWEQVVVDLIGVYESVLSGSN